LKTGFGNEWLKVGGVKIIADGAIAGRTAYLSKAEIEALMKPENYLGRTGEIITRTIKRAREIRG
jgi:predicted amidohydrolase YtcJ